MAAVLPTAVAAQTLEASAAGARQFAIEPQPLAAALMRFSRETGIELFYTAALTDGKTSPGVQGVLTPAEALSRLLAGTGLTYSFTNSRTITLEPAPQAGNGTVQLGTLRVEGSSRGSLGGSGVGGAAVDPADAPYRTAGSSVYLSGAQVEQRRGTSVGDFLSGIPGVTVGDSRNSGAIDVNIRGMQGQGRVPVIIDGASQEATVYRGYNGSAARSYVDPDFISEVSVEKGASMGADATGATGGVVRMNTIGVKDILLPGRNFGVRLKGGFNTNSSSPPPYQTLGGFQQTIYTGTMPPLETLFAPGGMDRPDFLEPTGWSGSITVAGRTDNIELLGAYARRKNGNYHAGENGSGGARAILGLNQYGNPQIQNEGLSVFRAGEEVLNTSTDNESWLLKGVFRLDDGHSIELGWNHYGSEYGEIFTTQLSLFGGAYQALMNNIELDTYTARYRWKPEDNNLIDLKIDAFKSDVDLRINSVNKAISWWSNSIYIGTERYGVTASNTSRFSVGASDFKIEYGGAWTREEIGYPDDVEPASVTWKPRQGSRREISGFSSLEWKPRHWLAFNGSLRYASFKTHDEIESAATANHSANGWSPVASLTVEPVQGLQFYGKYGSVLRSPSVFENLAMPGFTAAAQNPVDPERAKTFELGLNYLNESTFLSGDKIRVHAAYFDNRIDGYITRANVGYIRANGTVGYMLSRLNLDYADMRGFETTAEYDTGKYFGALTWNHYTHTMFCVPESVGLPSNSPHCSAGGIRNSWAMLHVPPKDTVTLNIGARLIDKKLTISGRLTYTGKRMIEGLGDGYVFANGEIWPPVWNPYTLVDLNAGYKVSENVTFDLAIDNLFDRYHLDALAGTMMPAPGRTLRGNLTLKF